MAQPHKGPRVGVILRLPDALANRICELVPRGGRTDWIIAAIEAKLKDNPDAA